MNKANITLLILFVSLLSATSHAEGVVASDSINTQKAVISDETGNTTDTLATEVLSVRRVGTARVSDSNGSVSQEAGSPNKMAKRWKWHSGHYTGVGIFYGGLVQNMGHLSLPDNASYMQQTAKSIGVNINLVDFVIVSNRHFGLITGLGLEINNFRFDQNMTLVRDDAGYIVPRYFDTEDIHLTKSKLTTTYLNIPLLAEFKFGRGRKPRGFINFGVVGGLRLEGHTKIQSKSPSFKGTEKTHGGLNLRNFHYGAEVNVGYSKVALSARYYPHSIFSENGGPQVQQVNIGISFMF